MTLPKTFYDKKWFDFNHTHPNPPYLDNIIEPIDISIGRQLWVDDYLIDQSNNVITNFHQAVDVKVDQPLLKPTSYERKSNSPLPDAVLYDYYNQEFKMWYVANYDHVPHRMC